MKLKDISRTATFAWDNAPSSSPLLATGAVSGALDASFSNDSALEIWAPDFAGDSDQGLRLGGDGQAGPVGSVTVGSRFNRLAWSAPQDTYSKGVIAAGMETGEINVYDPAKILSGASADEARVFRNDKHTGAVRGLDFNPNQKHLLLSGGINAELYIYDLNNPTNPMPPGTTSTKLKEITSLQWNPTVARIFAASSSSGFTSVWDLRTSKEIASMQYGGGAAKGMDARASAAGLQMGKRRGMSDVCWHPDQATRLVTASEDDESPIIMLWDLRNVRAPERILSGHQKGVLSVSWCKQDADLLLSCGKDNRTLVWNPQTGDIVGELPTTNDWTLQTTWCPRNPDILATASFDGHIGIHSLQTTQMPAETAPQFSETATADDVFGALGQNEQTDDTSSFVSLKQAPKWLKRPASATFGFGGLLASTSNLTGANGKHQSGVVHLRKIVTEQTIIDRAQALSDAAGDKAKLEQFCAARSGDDGDAAWKALQSLFNSSSRDDLVQLLGFSKEDVARRVAEAIGKLPAEDGQPAGKDSEVPTAADVTKALEDDGPATPKAETAPSEAGSTARSFFDDPQPGTPAPAGDDFFSSMAAGTLRNPTLDNLIAHKSQPADSSAAATIGSGASSVRSEAIKDTNTFRIFPAGEGATDKLITQALVLGDFSSAVELCLASERFADALVLAARGGPDLFQSTQKAYFTRRTTTTPFLRVFQSIVTEDLVDIVQNADLTEWKTAFVVLCTFARDSDFNSLAEQLGQRLQFWYQMLAGSDSPEARASSRTARQDATLCFLAARRLEKVIGIWADEMREEEEASKSTQYTAHALALQTFMEKVAVFTAGTGYVDQDLMNPTESAATAEAGARSYRLAGLYDRYYEYADLLATQGLVDEAAKYIQKTPTDYKGASPMGDLEKSRERLLRASGLAAGPSAVAGPSSTAFGAVPQQQSQTRGARLGVPSGASPYAAAPSGFGAPSPYGSQGYSAPPANVYGQPPTSQNGPYGAPPAPMQPPAQQQQQQQQQSPYGYNPAPSAPSQSYQSNAYAPTNGYIPAEPQSQVYGLPPSQGAYGAPPSQQQPYGAGAPAVGIPPPPRATNAGAASTPPLIPASQRRDMPGWNDAPSMASLPPKRPQSAAKTGTPAPIMSPFPMADGGAAPSNSPYGGPPPQQQQQQQQQAQSSHPGLGPPPQRGTPGILPPPPKGGPRPPSAQAVARAASQTSTPPAGGPPPPAAVSRQPSAGPPPPSMAFSPPTPSGTGLPPQQQQQMGGPPPPAASRQPSGTVPRGGPPPPGVMAGPPPPRALSPLGPPGRAASPASLQQQQQQQQYRGGPPPASLAQQAGQIQAQRPPVAGPPPVSSAPRSQTPMAGPPPPGRAVSSFQQQQPAAEAKPAAALAKPTHPAGDRSHMTGETQPIFETLDGEMKRVKTLQLPPHVKKIVDDTERRLNLLFDVLNNDALPKDVLARLRTISDAIRSKDANAALAEHVALLTTISGDMTAWAPGVRQLIRLGL